MDDQSAYYTEYNPSPELEENVDQDQESADHENEKDVETTLEVRGGVVNERDVELERGPSNLEKSRTRRSERSQCDPKLVCFVCYTLLESANLPR